MRFFAEAIRLRRHSASLHDQKSDHVSSVLQINVNHLSHTARREALLKMCQLLQLECASQDESIRSRGLIARSLPSKLPAALRPATPSGHNKAVATVAMFVSCDGQHLLEADPSSMRVRPFVDVLLWSSFFEDARHSTTMSNLTGVSPVSYQPPAAPQSLLCARHRWMGFNSTKISCLNVAHVNISARQMPVTKRAAGQGRYLMG